MTEEKTIMGSKIMAKIIKIFTIFLDLGLVVSDSGAAWGSGLAFLENNFLKKLFYVENNALICNSQIVNRKLQ